MTDKVTQQVEATVWLVDRNIASLAEDEKQRLRGYLERLVSVSIAIEKPAIHLAGYNAGYQSQRRKRLFKGGQWHVRQEE